jgi:hypothetical protein
MPERIYQFYIALDYIEPLIWRRFLVTEEATLDKLHKIIQIVMGWEGYHQYEFHIDKYKYGVPIKDWHDIEIKDSKKIRLNDLALTAEQKFQYVYDFGDYWQHGIKIEKIIPKESSIKYPKCVDGKRACPPEDCFGPPGYESLLKVLEQPEDTLDEGDLERLKWLGKDHDFEYFSADEVNSALWKRFAK